LRDGSTQTTMNTMRKSPSTLSGRRILCDPEEQN
jgi:hypothetical protein